MEGADSTATPPKILGTWDSTDAWADLSEQNHHTNADTASNASFESNASHRRRRPRGGRKPKKKLRSVNEDALSPEDQARLEEEQLREAERQLTGAVDEPAPLSASIQDERDEQEDYQGGAELQPETSPQGYSVNGVYEPEPQLAPQPEPKKFETGIKAFNIRKADPSGGRPMGTRIQTRGIGGQQQEQLQQQPQQPQQTQQQHNHPRHRRHHPQQQTHEQQQQPQGQKPQHQPQHHQQHIPPLSQTQAQTAQQSQGGESKEVSIKVDLNLEVEILLKAKIKGEIMITFL